MYRWVRERHMIGIRGRNFMEAPWAGGIVLLGCVIIAMLLANLPATSLYYRHLLETDLSLMVHSPDGLIDWVFPRGMTVEKLINDGLMVIFFFAVGLEIKREIVCGQLSSAKKALLPVLAAAGGMLFPAIIFTAFNHGTMAANGWGIPTATDIAFAIGILSMLGDRVPVSLKIFLTALAIADDLGAILVIALFYGGQVQIGCLLAALVIMLGVYFMKEMGEKRMFFYLVPAVVVWGLFYYSGVHSTISGVAMAMLIPMTPRYSKEYFVHKMRHLKALMLAAGTSGDDFPNENHRFYLRRMRNLAADSVGMSYRLEHALAPSVTFLVMPIFALANAGVEISSLEYLNIFHMSPDIGSVGMGVFFGLLVGKPLGIFLASWGAVKSGLAELPEGATWRMLFAVGCLGGIGFTMSLFVDALAYTETDLIDRGKIAILMGSTAAAVAGSLLILIFRKNEPDMRKTLVVLTAAALLAGACSKKDGRGREAQDRHRFGGLCDRYERGHEPDEDGFDDQRERRMRRHPRRVPPRDQILGCRRRSFLPALYELRAAGESPRLRGAVPAGYPQGEPQLRPHRIGRDLYGRGAGRSGADTRFGPRQHRAPLPDPHCRRTGSLLILRAGRYAAHDAWRPAQGHEGERQTGRQGRKDQRVDSLLGGLRYAGRQRAGDSAEYHAVLRNRACRCR